MELYHMVILGLVLGGTVCFPLCLQHRSEVSRRWKISGTGSREEWAAVAHWVEFLFGVMKRF
jgi:hypothetical protein